MKKNFFQILMGTLMITLGFTSCKKDKDKDCVDCATLTYDGYSYTVCVGDDGLTQKEFNDYVAYYKSEGYKVRTFKRCD